MRRTLSLILTFLIALSLLFPLLTPSTRANPSRDINVYVIKASDSASSWIGSVDNVQLGAQQAVSDAINNAWVKLAGENIYNNAITSTADLYQLTLNHPLHAVLVNTHGEVIPMPNQYFGPSVSITQPSDGGTTKYQPISLLANIYPPPSTKLQMISNPAGQLSYIWYRWYCNSIWGAQGSDWMPMTPQSDAGGTYYATVSLPVYGTYTVYVVAAANNIFTTAYVTLNYPIPSGDGGGGGGDGCPYVSSWDGSKFVLDNNLLPASEYSNGTDVVDNYRLQQPLILNSDGTYSLAISEFEQEHSFLDQVQLLAVDHPSNVSVAVSPLGEILTYTNPSPPVSAIDNDYQNVKSLLRAIDGNCYQGYNGSYVTINFGDLNVNQGSKLIIVSRDSADGIGGPIQNPPCTFKRWIPRVNGQRLRLYTLEHTGPLTLLTRRNTYQTPKAT